METHKCPHCNARVLPTSDDTCPHCGQSTQDLIGAGPNQGMANVDTRSNGLIMPKLPHKKPIIKGVSVVILLVACSVIALKMVVPWIDALLYPLAFAISGLIIALTRYFSRWVELLALILATALCFVFYWALDESYTKQRKAELQDLIKARDEISQIAKAEAAEAKAKATQTTPEGPAQGNAPAASETVQQGDLIEDPKVDTSKFFDDLKAHLEAAQVYLSGPAVRPGITGWFQRKDSVEQELREYLRILDQPDSPLKKMEQKDEKKREEWQRKLYAPNSLWAKFMGEEQAVATGLMIWAAIIGALAFWQTRSDILTVSKNSAAGAAQGNDFRWVKVDDSGALNLGREFDEIRHFVTETGHELEMLKAEADPTAAEKLQADEIEILQAALFGRMALVEFATWAAPTLAFLGTLRGMSNGLALANSPEKLPDVVGWLGVAFDSTFIALWVLVPLMLFARLLTRQFEQFAVEFKKHTDLIIRRPSDAKISESIQTEAQKLADTYVAFFREAFGSQFRGFLDDEENRMRRMRAAINGTDNGSDSNS